MGVQLLNLQEVNAYFWQYFWLRYICKSKYIFIISFLYFTSCHTLTSDVEDELKERKKLLHRLHLELDLNKNPPLIMLYTAVNKTLHNNSNRRNNSSNTDNKSHPLPDNKEKTQEEEETEEIDLTSEERSSEDSLTSSLKDFIEYEEEEEDDEWLPSS